MPFFNLLLHNNPKRASFWFSKQSAETFENTEFSDIESADRAIAELCHSSGTSNDDNYELDRPRAIPHDKFVELYAEESLAKRFWTK